MNRAAFLSTYYPDVRLTAIPGGKVEVVDPQRRAGLAAYVRAHEKEIWVELLKRAVGQGKIKSPAGDAGLRHMPWNRYNVVRL